MKILVTGASGWLGRHLIPLLSEAGYDVCGLDVVGSEWTDIIADIADTKAINDLFSQHEFNGVIHAAALHKPDIVRYPQQAFIDVNVTGTLNLLEAATTKKNIPFIFTSTTSLMITQKIRNEQSTEAIWLNEESGPIEPRNIYGVTKLAAEGLCRQQHIERGLNTIILRTSRFFPEDDDTIGGITGPNLKANELLNRRATVQDMARAHICALENADKVKFGLYLVSAPTPFSRSDTFELKENPVAVLSRLYPDINSLYAQHNWQLPRTIGRVYDGTRISEELGFTYETHFEKVLNALREGKHLPIKHDENYTSPLLADKN